MHTWQPASHAIEAEVCKGLGCPLEPMQARSHVVEVPGGSAHTSPASLFTTISFINEDAERSVQRRTKTLGGHV